MATAPPSSSPVRRPRPKRCTSPGYDDNETGPPTLGIRTATTDDYDETPWLSEDDRDALDVEWCEPCLTADSHIPATFLTPASEWPSSFDGSDITPLCEFCADLTGGWPCGIRHWDECTCTELATDMSTIKATA